MEDTTDYGHESSLYYHVTLELHALEWSAEDLPISD
jgi:hypothetical protein